jgi:hypothetical protein
MKKALAQVEKKYILEALHRSGGNQCVLAFLQDWLDSCLLMSVELIYT